MEAQLRKSVSDKTCPCRAWQWPERSSKSHQSASM